MVEGEFSSLEHLERSFPSDGKHLSVPSSHPWSRKGQVCVNLDAQGPHPSPGIFSWHSWGLHPSLGILPLASPWAASHSWYSSPGIPRDCIPLLASPWAVSCPDAAEDVPAHCRGLDSLAFQDPFQPKLFCSSMIPLQTSCSQHPSPGIPRDCIPFLAFPGAAS